MNACMVAYTFYENDNRVKRYAETLVERGYSVDIIALRKSKQKFFEILNGVNIYRIQKRSVNEKTKFDYLIKIVMFLLNSFIFLTVKHFSRKYKIVHVHSVPDFEIFAAVLLKFTGAKIILDIHDIVPEFYASKFRTSYDSILYKLLIIVEKLSIAFSDHVIISNHLWYKKLISRSASPKKCTTILNYPDPTVFSCKEKNKEELSKPFFIYPGTINYHQGLDIAIKAFALIFERYPSFNFYIYGEGPDRMKIQDLIVQYNLENRIFVQDFMPIESISHIMSNAFLGIIPKRNDRFGGEAFSTKSLEFMSLGVPVIISRTKIDSFYFDDRIVKYFDPANFEDLANSIIYLIENPDYREKIIKNGLDYTSKNNWSVKKNIYLTLIDRLTSF